MGVAGQQHTEATSVKDANLKEKVRKETKSNKERENGGGCHMREVREEVGGERVRGLVSPGSG